MIIGVNITQHLPADFVGSWTRTNARYLLGYNEPDFGNGKNHPHMVSAARAAADWPSLQRVAAQFEPPLELVSPSLSSSGPDTWDADGRALWLDYFLGNCTDVVAECDASLIKHIGFHDYEGDVAKLKRRLEGIVARYGGGGVGGVERKVWITEIAVTKYGTPPPRAAQDAYMRELLPYLDGADEVFRYSWFTARNVPNEQNGGSNLLPCDGSMGLAPTSTGTIYSTL